LLQIKLQHIRQPASVMRKMVREIVKLLRTGSCFYTGSILLERLFPSRMHRRNPALAARTGTGDISTPFLCSRHRSNLPTGPSEWGRVD